MPYPNQIKLLNFKERFDAYIIPYYVLVTGSRATFNKRFEKEFGKKIKEFQHFGEIEKAKEFNGLKAAAKSNFRLFTYAVVLVGFIIVILNYKD